MLRSTSPPPPEMATNTSIRYRGWGHRGTLFKLVEPRVCPSPRPTDDGQEHGGIAAPGKLGVEDRMAKGPVPRAEIEGTASLCGAEDSVETGKHELSHNNPIFIAERDWGAMPVGGGWGGCYQGDRDIANSLTTNSAFDCWLVLTTDSYAPATRTTLPAWPPRSSSSWARAASTSGMRSATTGLIVPAASSSRRSISVSRYQALCF